MFEVRTGIGLHLNAATGRSKNEMARYEVVNPRKPRSFNATTQAIRKKSTNPRRRHWGEAVVASWRMAQAAG